ncbi:MAG: ATP-binding protein [Campylobacteraceae bacterium]
MQNLRNILKICFFLTFTCKDILANDAKGSEENFLSFIFFAVIIILLIFLYKNITRRQEIEELFDSQRKFDSMLLDAIPHPVYYKNSKGEYLGCNKAFAEILGVHKSDIAGKNVEDFFPKDWAESSKKIDDELLNEKNGNTRVSEKTLHLNDGKMKQIVAVKKRFYNINGTIGGIVGVLDDITERAQQRQFLIQQSKLAEMGDMIGAVAHQWHEPLVELSAIVQDLEFSYKNDTLNKDEMNTYVKDAMEQIQYMSETLKDFRNFLKPSTQKIVFDVRAAFSKLLEIIGRQIYYYNIRLIIEYHPQFAYICVYGYENEFKQVLLNIINNAKSKIVDRFKDEEEKAGVIKIDVWQEYENTYIDISDNAGALNEDIAKRIFDPYFTTKKNGTGLGLYMAKVIIEEKMGGQISVRSDINNVTFRIIVPSKSTKIDLE